MAIEIYKKGNDRIINGLECGVVHINPKNYRGVLPEGHYFTPEEVHEEVKTKEEPETEAKETEKANEVLDVEDMCNHEVRKEAKEAGIEDWETARIATLKKKLEA